MSAVLFFIAALGAIGGAIGVVVLRNPFYNVLALVTHLVSLAVLFLLLRSEFVAAVQVVVYAGAVMVLYVFVVAYVGGEAESLSDRLRATGRLPGGGPIGSGLRFGGAIVGCALLVELFIALLGTGLQGVDSKGAPYAPGPQTFGTPAYIGKLLLTRFLLSFEIASFLLLIAAVGAVVLARRRGGLETEPGEQGRLNALDLLRPRGTGTMAEGVGTLAFAAAHNHTEEFQRTAQSEQADESALIAQYWYHYRVIEFKSGGRLVNIGWYLAVSAIIFSLGAVGVITRRNPLVVLLCLELMLNGGNLALIAFSRMWGNGDGQILALVVMTVAACEVCIGLGMIVAIYRRNLPIDVDELRELQG